MEKANKMSTLKPPEVRKSFERVQKYAMDQNLLHSPLPQATSTVEKSGVTSLLDPHNLSYNNTRSKDGRLTSLMGTTMESSLGIIDFENATVGLGYTGSKMEFKSLSFNPGELSGRSTLLSEPDVSSKENINPNETHSIKNKENLSQTNVVSLDNILREARRQSREVDDILKTSIVPDVANYRMSLNSFRHSLASNREEMFQTRTLDGHIEEDSEFGDSMFVPANQVNMSQMEASWMKEKGELPVQPHLSLTDTTVASDNNPFGRCTRENTLGMSKLSVGNYFEERSGAIRDILNAPSPEKTLTSPTQDTSSISKHKTPRTMGETFNKSSAKSCLPFLTISDDTGLTDADGPQDSYRSHCTPEMSRQNYLTPVGTSGYRDLTSMMTVDESSMFNPMSLTEIQNIVGNSNMDPSVLLDQMLRVNKGKPKKEKKLPEIHVERPSGDKSPKLKGMVTNPKLFSKYTSLRNVSPILPDKKSMDRKSDIFSSTRHGHENTNIAKEIKTEATKKSISTSQLSSAFNKSPTSSKYSAQFLATSPDGSEGFVSTLKTSGKSNSGSTAFTENSIKSTNTVVHVKNFNALDTIKENANCLSENKNKLTPKIDRSLSPCRGNVTPSDTSKELQDLVSPVSEVAPTLNALSLRRSKNLLEQYQHIRVKDSKAETSGWISPTQIKILNSSKECIAAQTPYRLENLCSSPQGVTSPRSDCGPLDMSDNNRSYNFPTKGDWIQVESEKTDLYVGITQNVNLKMKSLTSRWVLVEMSLKSATIDGNHCRQDINDCLSLQLPTDKVLIKYDTTNNTTFGAIALKPDMQFKIILNLKLTDIVTKSELYIEHQIELESKPIKLIVQGNDLYDCEAITFPVIPQESDTCIPIILWNATNVDLPVVLDVACELENVFCVASAKIVSKEEANEVMCSDIKLMYPKTNKMSGADDQLFNELSMNEVQQLNVVPKNKAMGLKVLLHYRAPQIGKLNGTGDISTVHGVLTISVAPKVDLSLPIIIQSVPIIAGSARSLLLIRNKEKSDVIMISQGSSESIELCNAGAIRMEYKLFMTDYHSGGGEDITLLPTDNPIFTIDNTHVVLEPRQTTVVKISYPITKAASGVTKQSLVFESPYTAVFMHVIGNDATSRCQSQQSCYSVESSASAADDIKIKATKTEMSWGSVKVGDSLTSDISFKNTSDKKKIKVCAAVTGESFRLLSDNGSVNSLLLSLQPQECRSLRVDFRPVRGGGQHASLMLVRGGHPAQGGQLLCKVPLHGVGEKSMLVFRDGVFRHGSTLGLSLGSLSDSEAVKEVPFTIWNKGTAPGFVLINVNFKWKYRALSGETVVEPCRAVLGAGQELRCCVLVPRRALLQAHTHTQAGDLGSLQVLHGNEALRHRIRKIHREYMKDSSLLDVLSKEDQRILKCLCARFADEDDSAWDFSKFRETPGVLKFLLDQLEQKEILLTYNVDLDTTLVRQSSDLDETLQFKTMCADSTVISVSSESTG